MENKASEIENVFNSFSISEKTAKEFAETAHKTLFQNFLRFSFDLIRYVGSGEMRRPADDRNQASVDVCKSIYNQCKEDLEKGIPYV